MFDIPPGKALHIRKWDDRHENHESRKIKSGLSWVRIPTSRESIGLQHLLRQKKGLSAFGCYILLVELGATMSQRGLFVRHDLPLDLDTIAHVLRIDKRTLRNSLEMMTTRDCPWFELVDYPGRAGAVRDGERDLAVQQNKNKSKSKNPPTPQGDGAGFNFDLDQIVGLLNLGDRTADRIRNADGMTTGTLIEIAASLSRDKKIGSWRRVLPHRIDGTVKRQRATPRSMLWLLREIAVDGSATIGDIAVDDISRLGYNDGGVTMDKKIIIDAKTIKSL
jgi:hypothetical protein